MRVKVLGAIAVCLAGLFGQASAIVDDAVNNVVLPDWGVHHYQHGGFNPAQESLVKKHVVQQLDTPYPIPPAGPVYRCHDPHPEIFGPAPPVEDCDDVIKQFAALTTIIDVKLVEGCSQIVSGNCTGLVCPQRVGESTMPGTVAAQYMASPLRDECIAKGKRGWWIDGQGWGIGVYLT